MGAAEISAAAAVAGAGAAIYGASQSGKGGSTGSPTTAFSGQNIDAADTGWLQDFNSIGANNQAVGAVAPQAYQQSYNQAQNINYDPYQQAANQAGQQYGYLADTAGQQMVQYQQGAQAAQGQQANLYGAGNQLMQTALDPRNALYDRTQQQLTDQVRAGQAARGIGVSGEGASEENQAMSNFNIDWQNQQLTRQLQGVQGMSQASNAGGQQGQLMGADMAGALSAGQTGAGYTQQAAQVPLTAQQTVAGMPASNANAYGANMGNLSSMYAGQAGVALPYLQGGQGAQQYNNNYNTAQNAAMAKALTSIGGGVANSATTPGGWLNNMFGSSNSSSGSQNYYDPSSAASGNGYDYTGNSNGVNLNAGGALNDYSWMGNNSATTP